MNVSLVVECHTGWGSESSCPPEFEGLPGEVRAETVVFGRRAPSLNRVPICP